MGCRKPSRQPEGTGRGRGVHAGSELRGSGRRGIRKNVNRRAVSIESKAYPLKKAQGKKDFGRLREAEVSYRGWSCEWKVPRKALSVDGSCQNTWYFPKCAICTRWDSRWF